MVFSEKNTILKPMHTHHTDQALLYKRRRTIQQEVRGLVFEAYHFNFLRAWIRRNRKSLIITFGIIVLQVVIESLALIFAHDSVRDHIYMSFQTGTIVPLIIIVSLGVLVYLGVTYYALFRERSTVLSFINELRELWFSSTMSSPSRMVTSEIKADTISKISYHLPLLSLGFDHSVFGVLRWFLSVSVLVSIGALAGLQTLGIVVMVVALSLALIGAAYYVAHHYISQEVTSYSQVIRHIVLSFFELSNIKNIHGEGAAIKDLDTKVGVDTYFRIRRDLWLRYFNRGSVALLFLASFFFSIVVFMHPGAGAFLYDSSSQILLALITIYGLRLLYESVQIGLYLPPLRLGILLSIPKNTASFGSRPPLTWKSLRFFSNKIKFFAKGEYFKNFSMSYVRGGRYLCVDEKGDTLPRLSQLLGKEYVFNSSGWFVETDEKRMGILSWMEACTDAYYIRPPFQSEKTLGELILAKESRDITSLDMEQVYAFYERYHVFSHMLGSRRFLGESMRIFVDDPRALCALQILSCIVQKRGFIVIDALWIDLRYPEIEEMIRVLDRELPDAVIVLCSRKKNDFLPYTKVYIINENELQTQ